MGILLLNIPLILFFGMLFFQDFFRVYPIGYFQLGSLSTFFLGSIIFPLGILSVILQLNPSILYIRDIVGISLKALHIFYGLFTIIIGKYMLCLSIWNDVSNLIPRDRIVDIIFRIGFYFLEINMILLGYLVVLQLFDKYDIKK